MKFTNKAAEALQQPDTQAVTIDMTPERKEKYSRIAGKVIDLLKAECEGPLEAYMILHFAISTLEEFQGIRGVVIVENQDVQQ